MLKWSNNDLAFKLKIIISKKVANNRSKAVIFFLVQAREFFSSNFP